MSKNDGLFLDCPFCGTRMIRVRLFDHQRQPLDWAYACLSCVSVPDRRSERFWKKVNINGPVSLLAPHLGCCWIWTSAVSSSGYGTFGSGGRKGKTLYAHRVAYEYAVGPIPEGLHVDHLCGVRLCVNPTHLEAVTQTENNNRRPPRPQSNICIHGHEREPGKPCRVCANESQRKWKEKKEGTI